MKKMMNYINLLQEQVLPIDHALEKNLKMFKWAIFMINI